ncbi:glutaredoxin family protein [Sediminicurvatus halobius]|uniref:Thioredoxin family protein n=1 Tax=Sediminicurvatus halobius TaxID=2182432 RepID=A0A2U2MWY2_9GAMM|nr:glutaredoxin family protein [Spiribacter halobius]PWG61359.1 hypothetical protein DEM34_16965 [Spiribacter halobius]UEX76737.1 glutaredoxin family protein [Spiribacter halobius]
MTGITHGGRRTLDFYTTDGCHLCDQALEMLWPVAERRGFTVAPREIIGDAAAESAYGERIPVVRRADSGRELFWPFSETDLYRFLL